MTQCEYCKHKGNIEKLKKMCEKSPEAWRGLTLTAEFLEEHPAFAGFTGGALRPLIREKNPEVQQKVISQIENARPQERKRLYGTEQKMKTVIRRVNQQHDKENLENDITKEPIEGKYNTIIIDPPWEWKGDKRAEADYNLMSLEDIGNIKLPASDNCLLFLWTVDCYYCEAKALLQRWGFEYKTTIIWDKEHWGVGYLVRQQHEYLIVARKGKHIVRTNDIPSVIREKRREHSRKPEIATEIIEKISYAPRIEIFKRDWDKVK